MVEKARVMATHSLPTLLICLVVFQALLLVCAPEYWQADRLENRLETPISRTLGRTTPGRLTDQGRHGAVAKDLPFAPSDLNLSSGPRIRPTILRESETLPLAVQF